MNIKRVLVFLISFIFSYAVHAADTGNTGPIEIYSIGCHLEGGTCYADVTNSYGPPGCNSSSIRWNKDTSSDGKEILSLLMAAFAAGKKVNFYISDSCYGIYPTFAYINVYK